MNNEITNPVNLILIIIGLFLGLSIGIFLLFNNSAKNKANIYLAIIVLLSITYFGPGFLFRFDLLEKFPHIIGTSLLVPLSLGPLTYLYVRACTQKGFKMRPILCLHFLPLVVDQLSYLPFFLQSGAEKYNFFIELVQLGTVRENLIMLILKSLHFIIYFVLSILVISKYKKHIVNSTSAVDNAFHSWILVFIAIHALPPFSVIIGFVFFYGKFTLSIILLCFFLFSFAVFVAIMVKPELFHSFPHQMPLPDSSEEKTKKYESSNLMEEKKERFLSKLLNYFEEEKPYLSPDLTLTNLAKQIQIPSHYLSQVINEKLDCNFLDFVNGYRVKTAKKLLTSEDSKQFTILSIAYDAGFNSKSTFYSAFKKHAGTTPSAYRKSLKVL